MNRHALITGGAGFIGSHVVDALLAEGWRVTVVDDFNDFSPVVVKRQLVARHLDYRSYRVVEADIRQLDTLRATLRDEYELIVHLAGRAGVRPSIEQPLLYQDVNVGGTQNLLEFARERAIRQFVFASSSSVYGINPRTPWREDDAGLQPISPYAATKLSGEMLGHVYSRLFGMRFVALRFFTVYGPRQRPDLAIHSFASRIMRGERLPIFGDGTSLRDYTYVDDIVHGVRAAMDYRGSPFEVFNLGNDRPVALMDLLRELERALGRSATLECLPPQPGDAPATWANIDKAGHLLGYHPATRLRDGLERFAEWIEERQRLRVAA